MLTFIFSLIGTIAFALFCIVLGASLFAVGMLSIYKEAGRAEEGMEILEFIKNHNKRKKGK